MRARSLITVLVIGVLAALVGAGIAAAPARAAVGPDPSIKVAFDRSTYRLGDLITGTFTVTNRGDAPAAGIVVTVLTSSMHVDTIDWGEVRTTRLSQGVLDRELAAGETVQVIVHASATGFLLAPLAATLTGRVEYTGDVNPNNNYQQVEVYYDTSGSTAAINGTVFVDSNRNATRDAGELGTRDVAYVSLLLRAPDTFEGVGINADGQYSLPGIIGQQYELRFGISNTDYTASSLESVYVFTLGAGGRTIDFGVFNTNAPIPTTTVPLPTTTAPSQTSAAPTTSTPGAPANTAPNPHVGGGAGRFEDVDTEAPPLSAGPTQSVPAPTTTDAAVAGPQPNPTPTVVGLPSSGGGSSSRWPWLLGGLVVATGLTVGGWFVVRRRRLTSDPS